MDTVHTTTDRLTQSQQAQYKDFGNVVDLSQSPKDASEERASQDGFIKDPMRRSPSTADLAQIGAGAGGESATRTLHVPLSLSSKELQPGTTVRILLDVKIGP